MIPRSWLTRQLPRDRTTRNELGLTAEQAEVLVELNALKHTVGQLYVAELAIGLKRGSGRGGRKALSRASQRISNKAHKHQKPNGVAPAPLLSALATAPRARPHSFRPVKPRPPRRHGDPPPSVMDPQTER